MKNQNYFAYATAILTIVLVYVFGELKHEKKIAEFKEAWLLEDTSELEEKIATQEETIVELAKKNKEYEIILGIIKLRMEEGRQSKQDKKSEQTQPEAKPSPQSTIPSVPEGYPGRYIPKGEIQNNKGLLKI